MRAEELAGKFAAKFPKAERHKVQVKDYLTMGLSAPADLVPVAVWLRDEAGFDYLDMVTGTDWNGLVDPRGYPREDNPNAMGKGTKLPSPPQKKNPDVDYRPAIELVYCLSSLRHRIKVFLKVDVSRMDGTAPTLSGVYKTAQWQEREVFDMLGVSFEGHPDLRKILTPDFMQGNPLRKDYVHKKDRFD